ncbi:MAG: hypothetical protein Q9162_000438 [Coniocarpon cinnabarinum]
MREVNFSIPSSNRASVNITTALYDRRALDCTSTLPLINSLNHLCYLTTSSARIREILTVDGGIERLICILKNGRSDSNFDVWKWTLAFHCVVNIGVRGSDSKGPDGKGSDSRGSENIRTRVVEADIVPVLATILKNYDQMITKTRTQQLDSSDVRRSRARAGSFRRRREEDGEATPRASSRRDAPPPISIPVFPQAPSLLQVNAPMGDRTTSPRRHGSHRHHRRHVSLPGHAHNTVHDVREEGRGRGISQMDHVGAGESTLLPPMTATSQPDTPLTPRQPSADAVDSSVMGESTSTSRRPSPRRPSISRETSTSENSDEEQPGQGVEDTVTAITENINAVGEGPSMLDGLDGQSSLDVDATDNAETVTLNIGHPPADGSIIDSRATPTPPMRMEAPVVLNNPALANPPAPEVPDTGARPAGRERLSAPYATFASAPRDEDVIMSLQLLAYISKYCDLRSYFQQTHFVPRLKIRKSELAQMEPACSMMPQSKADNEVDDEEDYDNDGEYCQPNDVNIFPLVENFTIKWHSQEMKYWAGVVMRNLCRKDKSRGDIRQCAYWKCGKWEDFAKQFAKCRRCRQTKYCSKECQKSGAVLPASRSHVGHHVGHQCVHFHSQPHEQNAKGLRTTTWPYDALIKSILHLASERSSILVKA